ncbi:NAD-dependent epimerase/dehydratase family protein [Agromyces atrinae]|uniref:NAD(P)-dependent oxidoreductase n=1 Tax=Agromyces atrinae TaxID=592376 RepID=A0A4V1R2I3_9MICO|nr:NAD(P)-dependent oxidoreductase [Agromyces atrinae]NYD66586.1 uronate dehydrogenase [Agromyces atrinae]RXZ87256.1 NAD(P)-dependent oxidoreductase [Agromyces atrinae]
MADIDTINERWAVTGAAGRIGRSIRRALRERVAELVLLDSAPIDDLGAGERSERIDLADAAALRDAFAGADRVLHLGAVSDEADFHDLVEANVIGTFHVFEAARQAGVARVAFASTGRVTGFYEVGTVVDSTMPVRPDGLYAVSKVAGEAVARLYAEKFGLDVVAVRIGAFDEKPRDARQLSIWLSPGDAERAMIAALTAPVDGFEILLAYSDNTHGWVDLDRSRALGYEPRDDASRVGAENGAVDPVTSGPHAGSLATPEFTLSRQRPF